MDYKKLGAAIGVALKKSELSASVGEFCGVSAGTVYGWTVGGCRPADKNTAGYFRIIKALKIDVSEFANVETVGGRIAFLRFKNEMTVSDLAAKCRKSNSRIFRFEKGGQSVNAMIADYLAAALNTTPEYILFGDKKVEPLRNGLVDLPQVDVEPIENNAPFQIEFYLKQIGGDDVNAVCARELWVKLEVKTDFSDWIKNRIAKYEFVVDVDFVRFLEKKEANNATMTDYFISLDMAKELSMVENNAQGKQARRYFIECEKQAKSLPKFDHLSPEVIAALRQARTVQLAMGMTKVQSSKYARDLIKDRFGFDMEHSTTGSCNKQLHLRIVK